MRSFPTRLAWAFLCSAALAVAACEDESIPVGPGNNLTPANPPGTGGAGGGPVGMVPLFPPPASADPNVAVPGAGAAGIGGACREPNDCTTGQCMSGPKLPGGYCSKNCGGNVFALGDACPTGSACVKMGAAASACLALCGTSSPCRDGYVCEARGETSVCVARCTSNRDCPSPLACNTMSGSCGAPGARTPGGNGEACGANTECISGLCLTEAQSQGSFASGYCVGQCTAGDANKLCPAPSGGGVCTSVNSGFFCLGACQTGVDCRPEYLCNADDKVQNPNGIGMCVPRCERYQCQTGSTCDKTTGNCVADDPMKLPPAIERIDLGTTTFNSMPPLGQSRTFSIEVTPGTSSFTIIASPANDSRVFFAKLIAPNGQVVMDALDPIQSPMKVPIRGFPGPFSLIYPNSPRLNLVPGNYQLALWGQGMNQIKVDVLRKRQGGVVEGGSIPVVFWFTKQPKINATNAGTDPNFQKVLATFTEIYAAVGVKIGPFIYRDLPPGDAEKYAVIDGELELLPDLFAVANQSSDVALNFFMVQQFALEGGFTLLGVAGGIPGPPGFPGLGKSGIAVALGTLGDEPDQLAETMAHEAGHFLGLFHTSERAGDSFDPLLDTPECAEARDASPKDQLVSPTECKDFGADNLMFWSASKLPQRKLTGDQRFVLFRNPSVQ